MDTIVVNLRNKEQIKRAQDQGIYVRIDRATRWGNPFEIGKDGTREEVIEKYRDYLQNNPWLLKQLPELKGKVLGCWCAPLPCHGDILLELANGT